MKTYFSVEPISAVTFARLCGGQLRDGVHGAKSIRGVCTDSREADAGVVFAAIRGERQDGHDFIASAIENGCRCILCVRDQQEPAQQQCAAQRRSQPFFHTARPDLLHIQPLQRLLYLCHLLLYLPSFQ